MCAQCKKPVELLTEIVASKNGDGSFRCVVECHGDKERLVFEGLGEVRRVHFNYGTEVFIPKQDGVIPVRRQIDL